jgi:hypothetical protein
MNLELEIEEIVIPNDSTIKELITKEVIVESNELKSIKYKTMLINGIARTERKPATDLNVLDKFLENEKTTNSVEPWNKLDKTAKIRKLTIFAETYRTENVLSNEEYSKLMAFLKDCLDRKKLLKVKEVIYDKINGEVKEIPALFHNKHINHFTLKNNDKHISTTRSLAPKKVRGTAKNVDNYDSDTSN